MAGKRRERIRKKMTARNNMKNKTIDTMKIPVEAFRKSVIVFQHIGYKGYVFCDSLTDERKEVFPAIFMEKKQNRGIVPFVKRAIGRNDSYIQIINNNCKDEFYICKECTSGAHDNLEMDKKREYLLPKDIEWPSNLGGGKCGGCPIISYYSELTTSHYKIISDDEIVSQSKGIEFFDNMCKKGIETVEKGKRCYDNYLSILKRGYIYDESDSIHIDVENGMYEVKEGKHRICAMKRYDYDKLVMMQVSRGNDYDGDEYRLVQYEPKEEYLDEYYEKFAKYGFDRTDVRAYLNSNQELVKIINSKENV